MTDDDRMDALLRQMAAEEYNRPPQIVPREQIWEAVQQGLGREAMGTASGDPGTGARIGRPFGSVPRWVYLAVAAVLLLAAGIQVGRLMGPAGVQQGATPPIAVGPDSLGGSAIDSARGTQDAVPVGREPEQRYAVDPRSDDGGKGQRPRPRPEPERFTPGTDDGAARAYSVVAAQHLTQVEALLTAFKGDVNEGRMDAQMASWGKDLLSNTRLLLDSPVASDPARRKLLQDLELVLVQIVQLTPGAPARDRDLIKGALTDDQVLTRLRTAIPLQKGT